jgi:GNAT superfamily N-acetyltransferase
VKNAHCLIIEPANPDDIGPLVELHNSVARALTEAHGKGHWSGLHSDTAIEHSLARSHVLVGRLSGVLAGTLNLTKKKPWAIDPAFFTPAAKPVYLLAMAVRPDLQRRGIGRALLSFAFDFAARASFDYVRLDAYDSPAGAAGFYSKCGMAHRGHNTFRSAPLVYFEQMVAPAAARVRSSPHED